MSTPSLQDRLASLTPAQRAILERRLRQKRSTEAAGETSQPTTDTTAPNPAPSPAPSPAPDQAPSQRSSLRERWAASKRRAAQASSPRTSGPQPHTPSAEELGPKGEIYAPLSLMQERIWVLDQIAPGNPAFNLPILAYRLHGPLRTADLQHALTVAEARHECLRTTFRNIEGDGSQVIHPPQARTPMPVIDLQHLPEAQREDAWEAISVAGGRAAYDLERGPLRRPILVRVSQEDHLLVLLMHHIVSDGWSMAVLLNDLHAVYGGTAPEALPSPRYHYRDFSRWQQERRKNGALDDDLAYWKQHLDGAPLVLDLPTDHPRPARQTFDGYRWFELFPAGLWQRMVEAHSGAGTTAFVYMLAVWYLLLYRLSGQRDVLTGCPMAGRHQSGTEALVGFFVNTLVLRANPQPSMSFTDFLRQIHDRVLEGFDHQDLPFHMLVQNVQGHRDPAYPPVFQTMFNFQNIQMPDMQLGDLPVSQGDVQDYTSQVDLILYTGFQEVEELGFAFLEFNSDLFDLTTIGRWHHHLVHLLEGVLDDPARPIGSLQMLGPAQRQQVLVEWPDRPAPATRPHSKPALLHEVLEPWLQATPDAIALATPPHQLSYAELWRRAQNLASHLRHQGVRTDDVVAVQLERTLELPITLLAVLLAGAGYLVLDPRQPVGRRQEVIDDAGARVLVTASDNDLQGAFSLLRLEAAHFERRHFERRSSESVARPEALQTSRATSGATPNSLAYLIYTSGSTGRPKGVLLHHAHAVRMLQAAGPWLHTRPGDTWAMLHSFAFDFSVWELWSTLSRGGRGLLLPGTVTRAAVTLQRRLREQNVAVLPQTPTALPQLDDADAAAAPADRLSCVHTMLLGGEALPAQQPRRWLERHPQVDLHNLYGPTEVTVYCTQRRLTVVDVQGEGVAPLGYSIAGVPVFVTDPRGHLAPTGVHGELYVGGDHLARGYLGRPALTAEKFVPDAFSATVFSTTVAPGSTHAGARLYRSGDLVRRDGTGTLHFLGRVDQQVKLRGFRIELGEIEARLGKHPEIAAAALRLEGTGDNARLVAYCVPRLTDQRPDDLELRTFLAAALPAYMLPARYSFVDSLPRTTSGKVDRKALARLAQSRDEGDAVQAADTQDQVAPRNEVEQRLAELWADALDLPQVSVDADFFELGGHSLLATRLAARIQRDFDIDLPVQALFEAPTIALLAPRLQTASEASVERLPRLEALPRDANGALLDPSAIPTSFTQRRLWFLERLVPGNPFYVVPVAWELRGALRHRALSDSLRALVARHEPLRTLFQPLTDGEPGQMILPPPRTRALPVVDLTGLGGHSVDEARRLGSREAGRAFDVGRETQLRTTLLRLATERHVLLLSLHHITSDGWSLAVLGRDLDTLYREAAEAATSTEATASTEAEATSLPPLPIQYADYAVWQRSWLHGEMLQRQLDWWRGQLVDSGLPTSTGRPPQLDLPTDRPRPAVARFRGAQLAFALPSGLLTRLERLTARSETGGGTTLFMLLLAAFASLLGRASGQRDLIVGSPVAGRQRAEVEDLIGVFINTLALRCRLVEEDGETSTLRQLVARLKPGVLGAFAHQDLPFERLVEALAPERDLSRNPLFQVSFALQNAPEPGGHLGDLELAGFPVELHSTHFDLEVHLRPDPDSGSLFGAASYDPDLFDRTTILRLCRHLGQLLDAAARQPDVPVDRLALLDAAQRHQLLLAFNDTALERPRGGLAERFVAVAERRPAAVAAVYGRHHLSYGELAHRADRLGRALERRGVAAETLVGLELPAGVDLLVGMLGVLYAGGAYLPIDPQLPEARRDWLRRDSGAAFVLRDLALLGDLAHLGDGAPTRLTGPAAVDGAQLAYVLYTSGSTGRPKGVAIPQQAVLRLVRSSTTRDSGPRRTFQYFDAADRIGQAATPSFDAATYEFWGALLHGGTVVGIQRDTLLSASRLSRHLRQRRVSSMFLAATVFQRIASERPDAFAGLDHLHVGGEAPSVTAVEAVLTSGAAPAYLGNGYGPTENTTFTTWASLEPSTILPVLPLGQPLLGSHVHILDRHLQLALLGAPGELCTGGLGLARGYFGRPALTAEKFVPDPFAASRRLYRTGDLARRRADGVLEFLGRLDRQVKIRGFRVEPDEVAVVLSQHPEVERATVLARPSAGGLRLLGYVVLKQNASLPSGDLRSWLQARLPDYLVPAAILALDTFPLTSNGKLDRESLPEPEDRPLEHATSVNRREARDAFEQALLDIWSELLGSAAANVAGSTAGSVDADFFDLGGHSLLATQVMSRVRRLFAVDLPLRVLFENPTPSTLAQEIRRAVEPDEASQAPPLVALPREMNGESTSPLSSFPLSFSQQRLWFLELMGAAGAAYHLPTFLELRGEVEVRALRDTLSGILQRHEVLRSGYRGGPDSARQVVLPLPKEGWHLPLVDLDGLRPVDLEGELQQLIRRQFERPFNLAVDARRSVGETPVFHAALVRLTGQTLDDGRRHALLLNFHHIAFDGWSLGLLLRELSSGYRRALASTSSTFESAPTLQYGDFAAWQQSWFGSESQQEQLEGWANELEGAPTLLRLPTDQPRGEVATDTRAGRASWHLDADTSRGLRDLGRRHGCTLFMTLVAGLQLLLGRLSGQDRVLIGSPIAGRSRLETEDMIGCFINPLVLHGDLRADGALSFEALLERTRKTVLAAYGRQDIPFEQVIQAVKPEPSLDHTPLFQVSFNLLNLPDAPMTLPGVDLEVLDFGEASAKFDLNFYVRERSTGESMDDSAGGIDIELHYRRALFSDARIETLLKAYEHLLRAATQHPEADASRLPMSIDDGAPGAWFEPARIERRLCEHPAVQAAAVVASMDADGELQWTACAVASPPPFAGMQVRLDTDALRRWLEAELPLGRLPALRLVQVEDLAGDKEELRRRLEEPTTPATGFMPPRTELEHSLAAIWRQLLDCPTVGLHDDFFDLGGHSLLAGRLQAAVRDQFGVELPLRALFEAPTLEALAGRIEDLRPQLPLTGDEAEDTQRLLAEIEQLSDQEVDERLHRLPDP